MLSKKNRTNKQEMDTIFQKGVSVWSSGVGLKFYIDQQKTSPKTSFTVSKKVEKLANKRNSLKRKGYLAIRSLFPRLPKGFVGAFSIKNKGLTTQTIKQEIEKILNKIH